MADQLEPSAHSFGSCPVSIIKPSYNQGRFIGNTLNSILSQDHGLSMAEDFHLWIRAAAGATIIPAEPLGVICLYIRQGGNSYEYSLQLRLDLLDAMADAGMWIRQHAPMQWPLWKTCFSSYLVRSMIAAREAGNLKMLSKQIELCIQYRMFRTLLQWQVARQIQADFKNRIRISRKTPLA
jgi:hypothetical protein